MEARTKLQEKREEAKQRYKDKRKNRRYVQAINIIKYYSQLSYVHRSICHTQSTPILKM